MVDEQGAMPNDPVLKKLAENRYWDSPADTDMLYYIKGSANGMVNKGDLEYGIGLLVDTHKGAREARVRCKFWN